MKRFGSVFGLALAVLAVLCLGGPGTAGDQVPLKGKLEGSHTAVPVDPSNPLILAVHLTASGNATHLGKFTYDFPHIVNRSVVPSTGVGSCTITAANGDQVFADVVGSATLVAPGVLHGVEHATITGGTGRFANASGSFTIDRVINQITLTTVGSFEGTISSPGASK
jgi:hypothetical protein